MNFYYYDKGVTPMITIQNIIMRVLFLSTLSFLMISCQDTNHNPATYNKLCQIYKEVVSQPVDLGIKEAKIVERVQKEFPNFFNDNFYYISTADPDRRYALIKRLAEEVSKNEWKCEIMKSYYENEFDHSAD